VKDGPITQEILEKITLGKRLVREDDQVQNLQLKKQKVKNQESHLGITQSILKAKISRDHCKEDPVEQKFLKIAIDKEYGEIELFNCVSKISRLGMRKLLRKLIITDQTDEAKTQL